MCVISINLSNLDSYWNPIVGKATKAVSEINEATNRLSKVKSDLNVEIRQRRDIAGRLYSISNSLIDIESDIREVENFLRNSLQRYHNADQTIKQLTANYGLEKESIGDKLKRVFLEWDGEKRWNVGKALVCFSLSVVGLVGAIVSLPATGPIGLAAIAISFNEAVSSAYDLICSLNGEYDSEGINFITTLVDLAGVAVGLKNPHLGNTIRIIGHLGYDAMKVATTYCSLKSLASINWRDVLTNVGTFYNNVRTNLSNAFSQGKQFLTNGKTFITGAINNIPSISQISSTFKNSILNPIVDFGQDLFSGGTRATAAISRCWNSITTTLRQQGQNIGRAWNATINTVTPYWESFRNQVGTNIDNFMSNFNNFNMHADVTEAQIDAVEGALELIEGNYQIIDFLVDGTFESSVDVTGIIMPKLGIDDDVISEGTELVSNLIGMVTKYVGVN